MHLREADFHSPSLSTLQGLLDFKDQNLWDVGDATHGTHRGPPLRAHPSAPGSFRMSFGALVQQNRRSTTWCWEVTFKNIMGYMGCKIYLFSGHKCWTKVICASKCASGWPCVVLFFSLGSTKNMGILCFRKSDDQKTCLVSQKGWRESELSRRGTVMLGIERCKSPSFRSKWPTYAPKITRNIPKYPLPKPLTWPPSWDLGDIPTSSNWGIS